MILRSYQLQAIQEVKSNPNKRLIVAMTGSGKSVLARELVGKRPALVLTFASVVDQLKGYFDERTTYVTSYNKFCIEKYLNGPIQNFVLKNHPVLVLDECQILKSPQNKVCKILSKIKMLFSDVYMFSACPAPNGLHEYYMASALSNGALGNNYFKFLKEYTVLKRGGETLPNIPSNRQYYLARGYKQVIINEEELIKKIHTFTYKVPDQDILADMPEQIFLTHEYKMESYDIYIKALKDSILELQDESIPLVNKLAVLAKLQQIESGFVYTERGVEELSLSKLNALKELLESIGEMQCVVFTNFIYEKELILSQVEGTTTSVEDFVLKKARILVGHPKSIGVGISLENAGYCIFYSQSFSYENKLQSLGRIYRISTLFKKVFYYDLIPDKPTITHDILKSLERKEDLVNLVTQAGKRYSTSNHLSS